MTDIERFQGIIEANPFAILSKEVSDYLRPFGFPQHGSKLLEECLTVIYKSKIVKAVVLDFAELTADGMVFPPILEFNVVLNTPQQLFDEQQADIIEDIGKAHDELGFAMAGLPIDTTISILNPDMYPLPNQRRPLEEIKGDGSVYRRRIVADLLFTSP